MKAGLLAAVLFFFTLAVNAQKDTVNMAAYSSFSMPSGEFVPASVSIYPVPVRDNSFTIRTDRDIAFVRITNIIGQDIFREKYSTPLQVTKIFLENVKRGMYLVVVIFSDGTKIVKKIMVEESD
jgi:Secretion system C-terminal sorting domain